MPRLGPQRGRLRQQGVVRRDGRGLAAEVVVALARAVVVARPRDQQTEPLGLGTQRASRLVVVLAVVHLEPPQPHTGQPRQLGRGQHRPTSPPPGVREHGHPAGGQHERDRLHERQGIAAHEQRRAVAEQLLERGAHVWDHAVLDQHLGHVVLAQRERAVRLRQHALGVDRDASALAGGNPGRQSLRTSLASVTQCVRKTRVRRIGKVCQQVHPLATVLRAHLDGWDQREPGPQGGRVRLLPAGGRVVIAQRQHVEPRRHRLGDQLRGRVGPVGDRAVTVQVDPHAERLTSSASARRTPAPAALDRAW